MSPAQVDQWKKMSHSNLVTLRQVFTSKSFGDHSMVFVYDFFPGSETLMSRWILPLWQNNLSCCLCVGVGKRLQGIWLIPLQAFLPPKPAWSQFAWPFQWGRFSTIQVSLRMIISLILIVNVAARRRILCWGSRQQLRTARGCCRSLSSGIMSFSLRLH